MSPYGGMLVEQSKFLPSDSDSQCNMDVCRNSHGSLIFLAFGTRRQVEQGHGSLIFLVWATQESRICDFERNCVCRKARICDFERICASGRAQRSDFERLCGSRRAHCAPGEPSVAPRGARRVFSLCFVSIFEPGVGHFRPDGFFQSGYLGCSVEPGAKPNI